MPKKILFIVSTLRKTGPTNQLFYLSSGLLQQGVEVSIVTLSPEPADSDMQKFRALNLTLYTMNRGRLAGLFGLGRTVREVVDRIQPDLVHTQGLRADILAASHLRHHVCVNTIRNYVFTDYHALFGRLRGTIYALLHLRAIRRGHAPVACSESIAAEYADAHNIALRVVQNGVDVDYYVRQVSREQSRAHLQIPQDAYVLLWVGSLHARKDPLRMLRVFHKLRRQHPRLYLCMVGDGPLMDACRREAGDDNGILLAGHQRDIRPYYSCADLFVSTSHGEGLPNTVLEALAMNLPLCVSEIAPHREILSVDASCGTIASLIGDDHFLECLQELIVLPESHWGKRPRDVAVNHFSKEVMVDRYLALYQSVMGAT